MRFKPEWGLYGIYISGERSPLNNIYKVKYVCGNTFISGDRLLGSRLLHLGVVRRWEEAQLGLDIGQLFHQRDCEHGDGCADTLADQRVIQDRNENLLVKLLADFVDSLCFSLQSGDFHFLEPKSSGILAEVFVDPDERVNASSADGATRKWFDVDQADTHCHPAGETRVVPAGVRRVFIWHGLDAERAKSPARLGLRGLRRLGIVPVEKDRFSYFEILNFTKIWRLQTQGEQF